MRKVWALCLLGLLLVTAGCGKESPQEAIAATTPVTTAPPRPEGTVYVLGPNPGSGWLGHTVANAQQKAAELAQNGGHEGIYLAADSGIEQNEQVIQILEAGDAKGVVVYPVDENAEAGLDALLTARIPYLMFDRILPGPDTNAILNTTGDHWQCGAGAAYWCQQKGLEPGDTLVVLEGADTLHNTRRRDGFQQFLLGELEYYDRHLDQTFRTATVWTQEEVDALFDGFVSDCGGSAEKARSDLKEELEDIIDAAWNGTEKIFFLSLEDEPVFGLTEALNSAGEEQKLLLGWLQVSVASIGGTQKYYDWLETETEFIQSKMTVCYSPTMLAEAIGYMEDYLSGNWPWEPGQGKFEPVWIVDSGNAAQYKGY